ncbi:MAG: hypothetical protein AB1736_00125 [Chloroflexota bacterium]
MGRQELERWVRPIVAGLAVLVTLLLVVGAAIRDPRPHDIPVGVSGPPAAIDPIVAGFGQNAPGTFAFTTYGSESDALAAIDEREIVGALIVGQTGPRLVVASGAGDAVTGAVSGAFSSAFAAQGAELAVETVNPLPAGDAHGIVLFFLVLATAIGSIVAGAAATLGRPGRGWGEHTLVLAGYAVLAGIVGVATAAWLADGYGDGVWAAMAVAMLLALAVSLVVGAAARWLGASGVALAAAIVVLLGLVSSGGPLGSAFLPDAYRAIAPWLPVGPAVEAMRSALAFESAAVLGPVGVLVGWAAIGLIGLAAADVAGRRAVAERPSVALA